MGPGRVVLVDETPSLGRALEDLLAAQGIQVLTFHDPSGALAAATSMSARSVAPSVLVSACNEATCRTERLFERRVPTRVELVVVGGRDPTNEPAPTVHQVPLPLNPSAFVDLVERLLGILPGA